MKDKESKVKQNKINKRKKLKEISKEEWDLQLNKKVEEAIEEFEKQGTKVNRAFVEQTVRVGLNAQYKIKE